MGSGVGSEARGKGSGFKVAGSDEGSFISGVTPEPVGKGPGGGDSNDKFGAIGTFVGVSGLESTVGFDS